MNEHNYAPQVESRQFINLYMNILYKLQIKVQNWHTPDCIDTVTFLGKEVYDYFVDNLCFKENEDLLLAPEYTRYTEIKNNLGKEINFYLKLFKEYEGLLKGCSYIEIGEYTKEKKQEFKEESNKHVNKVRDVEESYKLKRRGEYSYGSSMRNWGLELNLKFVVISKPPEARKKALNLQKIISEVRDREEIKEIKKLGEQVVEICISKPMITYHEEEIAMTIEERATKAKEFLDGIKKQVFTDKRFTRVYTDVGTLKDEIEEIIVKLNTKSKGYREAKKQGKNSINPYYLGLYEAATLEIEKVLLAYEALCINKVLPTMKQSLIELPDKLNRGEIQLDQAASLEQVVAEPPSELKVEPDATVPVDPSSDKRVNAFKEKINRALEWIEIPLKTAEKVGDFLSEHGGTLISAVSGIFRILSIL